MLKTETSVPRLSGYEILEKLGESPQSIVYKGFQLSQPNVPLVIKVLKTQTLSELQRVHYKQKIEHLKVLSDHALLRPISFEVKSGAPIIVSSHFEGVPLDKWYSWQGKVSLKEFFTISCQLAGLLSKVHEQGIIHGSIKPHNILVESRRLSLRLTDFITALDVREVSHFIYDRAFVKDTLAYTSPEQTGRINHRVDFTTDLYSLGVIFYELLTGRLPFFSLDPLELIHSHLAEEADLVHEVNPRIPKMVSLIIAKLILKQPEKRYQSSAGLLADLERCQREYFSDKAIKDFNLGLFDFTQRVRFMSKMVGRDNEANLILEQFEKVSSGSFSCFLISGLPGIGKTRLIQELQRPIVKSHGYFASGKFDIYQRNIPYGALIQSIRGLIRTFLTESDDRVEAWKAKILDAIGNNGKVLTDVIPELEVLIGAQPEVEQLPPVESRNRFNDTFSAFLICLASKKHPLTLFIDDLQWCDSATFDFFNNLFMNNKDHEYLFLLGAYRHNEVDSGHSLAKLINEIKKNKWPLEEVRLGPLAPDHCHEMVSYILDSPLAETTELSTFIADLSDGNPLFVSEVLSYLHNESLLHMNDKKIWQWNLERIRESDMPPTVAELFGAKVKKLSSKTVELLEYSACMGNRFLPTEIAAANEIALLDTFEMLKDALALGLLMESKESLQFVHDRVQEAVLKEINPEKRRQIHWEIGTHLLSTVSDETNLQKLDNLFQIVAHLNLGKPEKVDKETAYLISSLNYNAGNKALKALATEAANDYFLCSRNMLPANSWEEDYKATFNIFRKSAKTELMCGNYDASEILINQLLEKAKTDLDKAQALAEQTTSLSSIGNFIKAIETANRGLAFFEKALPADPAYAEKTREKIMRDIDKMGLDVWETIRTMQFTQERKSKIELHFYSELIPDLYMSGLVPQLYLSAAQSTQHCLTGGMDESVIYSFTIMALCLGEKGLFEEAFKYEDLAHDLCEKYPNTFGATRGYNGVVWCNMHSRSTPEQIVSYSQKGIRCGRNSGDLYNAGLCYGPLMWNQQVQGEDFQKIEASAKECLEFSKKYHLNFSVRLAEAMLAGWCEPMKKGYVPIPMEEKLKSWELDNHVASAGSYFVHLGLAHYYFGEYQEAEKHLQEVKQYLTGMTDNVLKRQWHVFLVLNALRLHESGLQYKNKDKLLNYINPLIEQVQTWSKLGPLLKPYLALLRAELERVTGCQASAKGLYLDAIAMSRKHGYVFLEGYVNESLGELLEMNGDSAISSLFIKESLRLYKKCGAERKEENLIKRFDGFFEEEYEDIKNEISSNFVLPNLDVGYFIKSATAILSEIEESLLLDKIMKVVIEASAAQRGILIVKEKGDLIVRAKSHVGQENVVFDNGQELENCTDVCKAIVRYVNRTKDAVILANAYQKGMFKDIPEVQAMKLRSVMCLPVTKQSELIGILYLDNHLAQDVFTPEKVEMTKLLTYQAAISYENARLVQRMKAEEQAKSAMVKKQTQEEMYRRLTELEEIQQATLNILDDFDNEKLKLQEFQQAQFNILEDMHEERNKLDGTQTALLNILDDAGGERDKLDDVQRALLNILDDAEGERDKLDNIQSALLNILDDVERDRSKLDDTQRALINILEDVEVERSQTEQAKVLLESVNKELESFSYSVSHDLRAPLRAVSGFTEAILEDYESRLDSEGKRYLSLINQNAHKMAQLIDDLLTFSRVGRREIIKMPVNLTEIANQIFQELFLQVPNRSVEFKIHNIPIVYGDKSMVRQVLVNLFSNSIKFTRKTKKALIEFGYDPYNNACFIKDNGVGFDMKYVDKLFGVFQRLHSETEFEGTGVGLALVHRIITRHGGEIWANSEMGKGTTFFFTLPGMQINAPQHVKLRKGVDEGLRRNRNYYS